MTQSFWVSFSTARFWGTIGKTSLPTKLEGIAGLLSIPPITYKASEAAADKGAAAGYSSTTTPLGPRQAIHHGLGCVESLAIMT